MAYGIMNDQHELGPKYNNFRVMFNSELIANWSYIPNQMLNLNWPHPTGSTPHLFGVANSNSWIEFNYIQKFQIDPNPHFRLSNVFHLKMLILAFLGSDFDQNQSMHCSQSLEQSIDCNEARKQIS